MTELERPSAAALLRLNRASDAEATALLTRCCGASRWVAAMLAARPFASAAALHTMAERVWSSLDRESILEAFSHHPEIGAGLEELRRRFASTAELSAAEQAGASAASEATLLALGEGNRAYRERFGYLFIVCASGKSADEMLALLLRRLESDPAQELTIAAGEQAKITRLRLERLEA